MSEFEQVQSLIRLKRHELPPENFVEDFVSAFRERQRAELLNQSARGLLWERVTTYFSDLLNPKWAWGAATAAVVVLAVLLMRPAAPVSGGAQFAKAEESPNNAFTVQETSFTTAPGEYEKYLLGNHYAGGFADEQKPQGRVYTTGFKGELNNFHPVTR